MIRGIPPCVKQEEFKSKKAQIDIRGASKAAVMEGDPKCPNFIEDSVYNTKPSIVSIWFQKSQIGS